MRQETLGQDLHVTCGTVPMCFCVGITLHDDQLNPPWVTLSIKSHTSLHHLGFFVLVLVESTSLVSISPKEIENTTLDYHQNPSELSNHVRT
jgi:hypothetical protein